MTDNQTTHPTSGIWRRLAAMLYDSLLVISIWMVVAFLTLSAFGITEVQTLEGDTVVLDPLYKNVLFSVMMLSAFIFFSWFWTHSGQTLGMQAWKIKVQNSDGSAISLKQCLIRFILAPFSFLLLGIGYFWMFYDSQNRTWHDIASTSIVIIIPR